MKWKDERNFPGPRAEATWPPYSGHPNDPRRIDNYMWICKYCGENGKPRCPQCVREDGKFVTDELMDAWDYQNDDLRKNTGNLAYDNDREPIK